MTERASGAIAYTYINSGQPGESDPAFAVKDLYYVSHTERWTTGGSQGIHAATKESEVMFVTAMDRFKEKFPLRTGIKFNLEGQHCWEDVLQELKGVMQEYDEKPDRKGLRGKFSRAMRGVSDVAIVVEPVVEHVVPRGDYASLACGGIILILMAFQAVHEVRKMVKDTVKESAPLLETVDELLRLYPQDVKLREHAMQLYIALLATIESISQWLTKSAIKSLAAIIKQGSYETRLKERISVMESVTKKLRDQADLCDKAMTSDIYASLLNLGSDMETIYKSQIESHTNMNVQFDLQRRRMSDMQDTMKTLQETEASNERRMSNQERRISEVQQVTKEILEELKARNKVVNTLDQLVRSSPEYRTTPLKTSRVVRRSNRDSPILHTKICIYFLGDWQSLDTLMTNDYFLTARSASPRTAMAITNASAFQDWLVHPISRILFVEYELIDESMQAGSFVTAALSRSLVEHLSTVVVTHWSLQRIRGDKYESQSPIANMLACLISGLLTAVPTVDLATWADRMTLDEHLVCMEARDVTYLCGFLETLIMTLSGVRIFFLIDDFDKLESATRNPAQLIMAVECMQRITASCLQNRNVHFKALLMTTMADSIIADRIRPDLCNWLIAEVDQYEDDLDEDSVAFLDSDSLF